MFKVKKIFNWFSKRQDNDKLMLSEPQNSEMQIEKQVVDIDSERTDESVEIPEDIFIEFEKPKPLARMEPLEEKEEVNDLNALYKFLEYSYEKKGYEDALMNPDSNSMEEQVKLIRNEFNLMISKVKTHYSTYTRTIDFHIDTRKRNGMVETVDELETHKQNILEEINIVNSIHEDDRADTGLSQNRILSYRRGFKNGFAAITFNNVLGRKN